MGDHRSTEERQMDSLIDVLVDIREALDGIRAALHPCEYFYESATHDEPCDCRADRMVDDCWFCEVHAAKAEEVVSMEKAK